MLPRNKDAPHRVVIFVQAQIHEVLPTGECDGAHTERIPPFPLSMTGENHEAAEALLGQFILEVKKLCSRN